MNGPFSVALVDGSETTFGPEHMREDFVVLDLALSESEGDFANLAIEIRNPRVGLLAPGRPRWLWLAWNPNYEAGSSATFDDMVPLFFGRVQGVPTDFIGETVSLNFLARPMDYEAQKDAVAETLRVLPYFDGVWFKPEDRFDADNVLESRPLLWNADRVTHVVSTTDITSGEDGTINLTGDDVLDDSLRISYGDAPCRQVNVTATVSWDQIASGPIWIIGGLGFVYSVDTFTGAGLQKNWPQPGFDIGGGWSVRDAICGRHDYGGNDEYTYTDKIGLISRRVNGSAVVVVPPWAEPQYVLNNYFPGHAMVIKKWKLGTALSVQYDVKRGKQETVTFSLRSNTQSILTDSTAGEAVDLSFATSEVAQPVGVFSDGTFDVPLGKPWARSYVTTDRGEQSIQYLILVARARLLAAARCVDVTFEIPWNTAIAAGISCRKNVIIAHDDLPGGVVGGKVKAYALHANGDSGTFVCEITIGCSIGLGGEIEAVPGEPDYVNDDYVEDDYQFHTGGFVMPVPGEVAYRSINGLEPTDDGFDFDRMTAAKVLLTPVIWSNEAAEQAPLITVGPKDPAELYAQINTKQTSVGFQLKPLNNGPFFDSFEVETTLLTVPKTIDLEQLDSSS